MQTDETGERTGAPRESIMRSMSSANGAVWVIHFPRVVRHLQRGFRVSREDAEDIAASALIEAASSYKQGMGTSTSTYFFGVARNRAIDWKRSRRNRTTCVSNVPEAVVPALSVETLAIRECMERCLTNEQRALVDMHYVQGMTLREIASEMGLSKDQVAGALRTAKARLKKEYGRKGTGD